MIAPAARSLNHDTGSSPSYAMHLSFEGLVSLLIYNITVYWIITTVLQLRLCSKNNQGFIGFLLERGAGIITNLDEFLIPL